MKMEKEHFDYMRKEIDLFLNTTPNLLDYVHSYEEGEIERADRVKDLQMRFCFDTMRYAGLTKWVCDTLYTYLDDTHIYTALKAICPSVHRKY